MQQIVAQNLKKQSWLGSTGLTPLDHRSLCTTTIGVKVGWHKLNCLCLGVILFINIFSFHVVFKILQLGSCEGNRKGNTVQYVSVPNNFCNSTILYNICRYYNLIFWSKINAISYVQNLSLMYSSVIFTCSLIASPIAVPFAAFTCSIQITNMSWVFQVMCPYPSSICTCFLKSFPF